MSYDRRIDRLHPALIIVLVDQSDSMTEPIGGSRVPKAQAVADRINLLLHELVLRCAKTRGEPPRPYFSVSVIGYSTTDDGEPIVESVLRVDSAAESATTTELAADPLRIESRPGPRGGTVNAPVWVEPVGRGGTPMCAAIDRAGQLAASWVA